MAAGPASICTRGVPYRPATKNASSTCADTFCDRRSLRTPSRSPRTVACGSRCAGLARRHRRIAARPARFPRAPRGADAEAARQPARGGDPGTLAVRARADGRVRKPFQPPAPPQPSPTLSIPTPVPTGTEPGNATPHPCVTPSPSPIVLAETAPAMSSDAIFRYADGVWTRSRIDEPLAFRATCGICSSRARERRGSSLSDGMPDRLPSRPFPCSSRRTEATHGTSRPDRTSRDSPTFQARTSWACATASPRFFASAWAAICPRSTPWSRRS